jgi:hypothetical protein
LPPIFRWVRKSFSGVDPYRRNRRFRNDTTPKRSPNRFGNDLNTQKRKKKKNETETQKSLFAGAFTRKTQIEKNHAKNCSNKLVWNWVCQLSKGDETFFVQIYSNILQFNSFILKILVALAILLNLMLWRILSSQHRNTYDAETVSG